jgi:hypothetical protein
MEPKPAYIANQANPPSLNPQAQQADQLRSPASSPTSPAALPILLPLARKSHPSAVPVALSSTSGRTGCGAAHARPMGQAPWADSGVVYVHAIKKVASYVYAMKKFASTCMPRTRSLLTYMPFWMDRELTEVLEGV